MPRVGWAMRQHLRIMATPYVPPPPLSERHEQTLKTLREQRAVSAKPESYDDAIAAVEKLLAEARAQEEGAPR